MTVILDGLKVAEEILKPVKKDILDLKQKGIIPYLAVILIGEEDPQSVIYIREKRRKAKEIGIKVKVYKLKQETKFEEIRDLIENLNQDLKISGIIIQLPMPKHLNTDQVLSLINPKKDVDSLIPVSPYTPTCAGGIMEILKFYHLPVRNQKVIILGAGRLVGQPLFKLMEEAEAKVIFGELKDAKSADILVGATPLKNIIKLKMVKKGAVVIDAAQNVSPEVKRVAGFVTPKFGGVGPVTVSMLLKNVVVAAGS